MLIRRLQSPLTLLLATALAACGGTTPDDGTKPAVPRINDFSANPTAVAANGTTTLSYNVAGATSVKIDIKDGASVLPSTTQQMGQIVSPQLTADTIFVLTAANATGMVTREVTVTLMGVNPTTPVVNSFAPNPATINAGQASVLSWSTSNAASGRIEGGGTVVYTLQPAELASGSTSVSPSVTTQYTLVIANAEAQESRGQATVTVNPVVNGPTVSSFTAAPASITAGMQSTLTWATTNATSVAVTDAGGAVVYSGTNVNSTATVSPIVTTTYTVTAMGTGTPATMMTTVTVTQPTGAVITAFTANPTAVAPNAQSTLSWTVINAPGGIVITTGSSTVTTSANLTGTFNVNPAATTIYTLHALNPAGNATPQDVTVTVNATTPSILTFTAATNPAALNASTVLNYTAANATRIRILNGATELYNSTTALTSGSFTVPSLTAATTTFTAEASDGVQPNGTAQVIVYAHPAPVIVSFTATPPTLAAAGQVTLAWNATNVSNLTITANGTAIAGSPFVNQTTPAAAVNSTNAGVQVNVTANTTFVLTAVSAGGSVNSTQMVTVGTVVPGTETEPNNTIQTANTLPAGGGQITGNITPTADIDFFSVTVAAGGFIRAQTSDGAGGCTGTVDTAIVVFNSVGQAIAFNDDIVTGNACSFVDPANQVTDNNNNSIGAGNLAAGTYYVAVQHYNDTGTGTYTLNVTVGTRACGNNIFETLGAGAPEQCDFGDAVANDGCSATCQLEINATQIGGTGGNVTVTLGSATAIATVRVNVTQANSTISVVAADPGGAACNNVDTAVNLGDSAFLALGGKADGGPTGTAGNCAAFIDGAVTPPGDAFASNLAVGTYYLIVFNQGATNGQVEVRVTIRGAVCGNNVVEGTEQCDNAFAAGGIPCNQTTCQVIQGTPVTLPSGAAVVRAGALAQVGEVDLYRLTVGAPGVYVNAQTFAPNQAGACSAGDDTVVAVYTDQFVALTGNDEGGTGISPCSLVDDLYPSSHLAAGTYWVGVFEYQNDATIAGYELVLNSTNVGNPAPLFDTEPNDVQAVAQSTGLTGVAGTRTIEGVMDVDGDDDVYSFTVPANATRTVTIRTYDDRGNPSACTPDDGNTATFADTRIFLEQAGVEATAEGTGELAFSDDIDGVTYCSLIASQQVTAGPAVTTFYVRVQAFGDAGYIEYFMDIQVQ